MERHFEQGLESIRKDLLRMAGEVEGMLADAIKALLDRDDELATRVIERDRFVDRMEKSIDEQCHAHLVRQQPAATDLRFLIAVMKIVNDLERVGDCAKNIAGSVLVLSERAPVKPYVDLPRMGHIAGKMLKGALDSFVERDAAKAVAVCERDQEIDELYEKLFRELATFMTREPKLVDRCLHLILVAHNLERIADHATNVSEDVVYYLEGRDIRHSKAAGASG